MTTGSVVIAVIDIAIIAGITIAYGRNRATRPGAQTTVTILGILGTFAGIYIGLIDFNPRDISSSVPALLSGMKTAFLTSIAGMTAAVYLKIRDLTAAKASGKNEKTLADLVASIDLLAGHLDDLMDDVASINGNLERLNSAASHARIQDLPKVIDGLADLAGKFDAAAGKAHAILTDDAQKNLEQITARLGEATQNVERIMNMTRKSVEDNLARIDQALEQELTNSLRALGANLASLSGRFVEDYGPLTERLREIVRIAEQVPVAAGSEGDGEAKEAGPS